jgi:hypothetical protein
MQKNFRKRSFALTNEGYSKLDDLKEFKNHKTLSETVRFCVDYTFDHLLFEADSRPSDEVLTVVQKNNILLRVLLIESIKGHNGGAAPLSEQGRQYLKQLQAEIRKYMESHNIEVEE